MIVSVVPARRFVAGALCVGLAPMAAGAQTAAAPAAPAAPAAEDAEGYLLSLGLGAAPLRAAAAGQVVSTLLRTADSRDVTVAGIIGVRAPHRDVVTRALEDPGLVASPTSRLGIIGDPPAAADAAGVSFDRSEYRALKKCRPGDCDFKLSADEMEAFTREIDWSAPDAKAQADARLRAGLLRLADDYRRRGNAALPTYNDGGGTRASDAFAALLDQSHDLFGHAPELFRYLETYPGGRPAGARDVVYWSEERLPRMRPTLTLNHAVTYVAPSGTALVAKKQLYASHYFEGGLEVLAVVDAGTSASAGTRTPNVYLIVVRRFRFDYLPVGLFNIRGRVRSHLMAATRADLVRARTTLEKTLAVPERDPERVQGALSPSAIGATSALAAPSAAVARPPASRRQRAALSSPAG